jgi:methionyl-tRNA formyltransferase
LSFIIMSDLPKIVYFGSDAICLPGLKYLYEQGGDLCRIAGVVSQPDRRQGRGKKMQQNPVAEYASSVGLPLFQPEKPGRELGDWLRREQVTLAFVMAYGHFLPKFVREAPAHGMLNFHGSLLPAYRGASPVETAIAMGEEETGVCLMQVVKEMDAGAVADCERVRILQADTGPSVRAKIGEAVVPLLQRDLAASLCGGLDFVAQDASQATFCRKISKEDAAMDFTLDASAIDARLRAFTPWPGGYFDHGETRVKVGRCSVAGVSAPANAQPGEVLALGQQVEVATTEGVLCMHELQRPGGRMLPVADFLRGYPMQVGELLPSVPGAALLV